MPDLRIREGTLVMRRGTAQAVLGIVTHVLERFVFGHPRMMYYVTWADDLCVPCGYDGTFSLLEYNFTILVF